MTTPRDDEPSTSALPIPVPRSTPTTDIALVATFAALLAVCSLTAVSLGAVPVPVTLQTFGVLLAGAALGPRRGAGAVLLYLAVGFAGMPVFAQGAAGLGVLVTPSAGYLLAFPLVAWLTGQLVVRTAGRSRLPRAALVLGATLVATVVLYSIGVPFMAWRAGVSLPTATGWNLVFLPLDLVKAALAAIVASAVHRAFPDLLQRRR